MKSMNSKIIIADDHALVREGLKRIISLVDDITVVGEAIDGWDVLEKLQKHPCQVLVLDMSMPGISGIELIKRIRQERPLLPILVLSLCDDCHFALRALKAGANGYAAPLVVRRARHERTRSTGVRLKPDPPMMEQGRGRTAVRPYGR